MSLRSIVINASAVILTVFVVACGDDHEVQGIFTDPRQAGKSFLGSSDLFVVAHPDDDLLFMSPDVAGAIAAGRGVLTSFLTAGDDGRDASYWEQREEGIRAAYATMVSAPNHWFRAQLVVGGKAVLMDTLDRNNRVHLVFFRLPDGHIHGGGSPRYGSASLMHLWNGQIAQVTSVDGMSHFTRDELIDTLHALMLSEGTSFVGTLNGQEENPSSSNRRDHSDHAYSARFALEAARRLPQSLETRQYRGYDISDEAPNLDGTDIVAKHEIFHAYAEHDPAICPVPTSCQPKKVYRPWLERQYLVPR